MIQIIVATRVSIKLGLMATPDLQRPFPDYVTCPHCGEPEVEVWCHDAMARCHACGQAFEHPLPVECADHCDCAQCAMQHPAARPSA
jgi:hypothetical protein